MNTLRILTLCLITTIGFAQKKQTKTSQSIKVNKDVVVDLNTNYVEIEIEKWNKDIVEIEAYVQSSKLSEEELKKSLKAWNLNVDASKDKVYISSEGGRRAVLFSEGSYDDALKSLEMSLAELPEIVVPNMANFPELPELPEMPAFPELPELPKGVTTIQFDYDKYQEQGEKYLTEWSKKYEKEGGEELKKRMEDWAKRFAESGYQEKMEKWGEKYGKRFEGKWAKDMEKWGEKFGKRFEKDMEKWGEEFGENFGKDMEKWGEELGKKMEAWGERFGKQMEEKAKAMEERSEAVKERAEAMEERQESRLEARRAREEQLAMSREEMQLRRASILSEGYSSKNRSEVKRVIKIKMPKKAKLKLNVSHGELKIASLLDNIKGSLSHTDLLAENIGGSDTSINVAYAKVLVNDWNSGTLSLKYVDDALLKNVQNLTLNSNSSNINIDRLSGNNIMDGSFGELTIHNIDDAFNNLNIVIENSEAWVKLPTVDYSLLFRGERSKFNNQFTKTKTINGSSGKSIVINAKYSNVVTN